MKWRLLIVGGLAAVLAAPASAFPKVTLHAENVTLREALRMLSGEVGMSFVRGDDGDREVADGPGEKRASFDWRAVPVAHAMREICERFGVTVSSRGPRDYAFFPLSREPVTYPEATAGGVRVRLESIEEMEEATLVPGEKRPRVRRMIHLQWNLRALSGEGLALGPLTRVVLTDEAGKTREAPLPPSIPDDPYEPFPDQAHRRHGMFWDGPMPHEFRRIDLELGVFDRVQERRISVPLDGSARADYHDGPVDLHVYEVGREDRKAAGRFLLEWPRNAEIPFTGQETARLLVHLKNGQTKTEPVYEEPEIVKGRNQVVIDWWHEADAEPTSIEFVLPLRTGPPRRVTLTLRDVPSGFASGPRFELRALPGSTRDEGAGPKAKSRGRN